MKRLLLAISTIFLFAAPALAAHIKGGFFTYRYLGPGAAPNTNKYTLRLTVYMSCAASGAQISDPINFSIFDVQTNTLAFNPSVSKIAEYNLGKVYDEPCITGNQIQCYYKIVVYELAEIDLPSVPQGYILAYQRCCRIAGIQNVQNSGNIGNTFSILMPGSAIGQSAETNSSPVFPINDTVVVCGNSYFQYSFQASDPNTQDSLSYYFCQAFQGGSVANAAPNPATNPPFGSVPYQFPYSGTQPMGNGVTINPVTGLISGNAPPNTSGQAEEYVICVCVDEFRNGVLIGTTRKELHIQVGACEPLQAQLDPIPTTCDGFGVNFENGATNPPGTQFVWTFGEPSSGALDTSYIATPSHTYTDTGVYSVQLVVALPGGLCADTAVFTVKVYPGFFPGFIATGSCFTNPYSFQDTTNTSYGFVDSWSWNFGDLVTLADTSHTQNPTYTFPSPGIRTVRLIVTNSKGCIDTALVNVDVLDKPLITMDFTDTLICIPDAVTLGVSGTGTFSWTPLVNITNPNTANPTVNPSVDTWYVAQINDNGCINKDSVHVRVVPNVSVAIMPDTTICRTDQVTLNVVSDGLTFSWTNGSTLSDPTILNPVATPTLASTTYILTATIGSCSATDQIIISTVPYPVADAGPPQTICYNTSAQLNGSHDGTRFFWTPTSYLDNPAILNPVATPPRTTSYVLTVNDDLSGCPKPSFDTVVINVRPRIHPLAGNDTTVIVGQPLQLNASGGTSYQWIPGSYLNNPNIPNPVGIYPADIDSIRYKLLVQDVAGCADSAFITVYVWKTNPYVFVPTAFTPNGDGRNDVIRPIAVGIARINYFSVYNRWGQLLFTTTKNKHGWDGRVGGELQASGVFVWMVSAKDYLGKDIFLKGTVTLIR